MKIFNRIILLHDNSYIGRFVRHFLEKEAVEDPGHVISSSACSEEEPELLVIADPECGAEEVRTALSTNKATRVVLLSSARIYDADNGENLNELTPLAENSVHFSAEKAAAEICAEKGMQLTILRLPELIVGTGMGGMLIRMVEQINRGTYCHIKDCECRRSVIHASSIGRAVVESVPGIFNIADPEPPTVRELAEALSFRIGQKRISSVSLSMAKKMAAIAPFLGLGGWKKDMLEFKTGSLTFSTAKAESAFGFSTEPAVGYLKTHNYDENSL